ncbi:hypothetical protein ATL39_0923 [Sinobaca qinghaiensis]|uniref:Uncharacterized protein n=1 Tax=Sinobaca qinghaiensis TaxID=342944 RepID=A0A419V5G4_9BACL|nr:hypothetical protein ATL39_0923 [Sinobaca qinghaiensis]
MIVFSRCEGGMEKGYTIYAQNSVDLKEKLDRLNIRADNVISLLVNKNGTASEMNPVKLNEL